MTPRFLAGVLSCAVLVSCNRSQSIYFQAEGTSEQLAVAARAAAAWNAACGQTIVVPGKGGIPIRFIEDALNDPRVGGDNADEAVAGTRRGEWDGWQNLEAGGVVNIYLQAIRPTDDMVEIVAHEMGHALGLSHLTDERSLMYPLGRNVFRAQRPTERDVARLEEAGHFCTGLLTERP